MLKNDDIERILEIGEEFGLNITPEDADTIWKKYTENLEDPTVGLPFEFDELADIIIETAKEIGVGGE